MLIIEKAGSVYGSVEKPQARAASLKSESVKLIFDNECPSVLGAGASDVLPGLPSRQYCEISEIANFVLQISSYILPKM